MAKKKKEKSIAPIWEGTDMAAAFKAAKREDSIVVVPHFEVWEPGLLATLDGDGDEEDKDTFAAVKAGRVRSWIHKKATFMEAIKKLVPTRPLSRKEADHLYEYG
jgi:hypothetical protein